MKAAQINEYGSKDAVKVTDSAVRPKASKGQVLVEVHAAGVNPFDITVREGRARQMAEPELPATLGGDLAGIVAEVGEGVEGWSAGQAVYGQAGALSGQGSFAEYAPVQAAQLSAKPESLDFVQSAALPLAGVSAYQALVDHIGLQTGQKILIHGGAGGIGSLAVQIAKHIGAHVAVTAGADDIDFVKGLGADEVIDYKKQDFTKIIKDYDAVFDTVGGDIGKESYPVLRPGGKLVSMLGSTDEDLATKYQVEDTAQFTRVTTTRLEALAKLVDSGAIRPVLDKTFPLDQAASALDYLQNGHAKGKVVIQVKE